MSTAVWVIQDGRSLVGDRMLFWAKDGRGYTTELDQAEHWTQEAAQARNIGRETNIPWPLAYLEQHAETAVDCQYLRADAIEEGLKTAERSYLYAAKAWNGNDLYWLTDDGDITSNFARAHAFPIGIARSMAKPEHHNVRLVPAAVAEQLARKVVPAGAVKIGIALRGTGVVLAKPPRVRSTNRCYYCGVFISRNQVADGCPKCGKDNLP
ncbi:hypothetical protein [Pseudomonas sp. GD03730]|uniref:hypothetical protein n=1 Tax=Pseudomonas sp. GD03730 TaxID=2975375 RepID=UPI00244C8FF8|nr:hypothetical protein [Pseudomonas sp. GD03730]MDH1403700.1 hypothetical protein [Pseudomonas sp. GD03730]